MPTRRALLSSAAIIGLGVFVHAQEQTLTKWRAAVIGHTGNGDYGHGLDTIFAGHTQIEVVAVADENEAGRAKAQQRCNAKKAYDDFRKMLDMEKPSLVSVAPRTTGERREMLLAALGAGAHVVSEKPFVRTPADGDQVLKLAADKKLKTAVTHQMRVAPSVVHLKKRIADGLIGDLLEMHAFGKQDPRAGGEDMVVLGTHLFDLMRLFAGDPQWCSAAVWEKGREATAADARQPGEDIGPVLGDEISAQFAFPAGVTATFTSRARMRAMTGHWGIEFVGSKGAARILSDIWPRVFVRSVGKWEDAGRSDLWRPLDDDPALKLSPDARTSAAQNARIRDGWLRAIEQGGDPPCSGRDGAWAVEMVHAVWRAALSGSRITFPLRDRSHALLIPSPGTPGEGQGGGRR
jgi:predicted dehydrogenase